jgi:hypothetical protein
MGATLATPALSGLSTSTDLLLGIYDFGSTFALANLTQTGSLIYDPPSAQTGYPGQCVGFWGWTLAAIRHGSGRAGRHISGNDKLGGRCDCDTRMKLVKNAFSTGACGAIGGVRGSTCSPCAAR